MAPIFSSRGSESSQPGDRRPSRADRRRMAQWLAEQALGPDAPDDDAPGPTRVLARITGGGNPYSWEFADQRGAGVLARDLAGFSDDGTHFPAYELSGNPAVPVDGSAIVELWPTDGGLGYWFSWPRPFLVARIQSGTPGTGGAYPWKEQSPSAGGTWVNTVGGRTGTATVNPAYERSGSLLVPSNAIVLLERGYGAAPDVATAITTHGDGSSVHQQLSITITGATGGTWALTLTDASGNVTRITGLSPTISAAALQTAIRAITGFGTATVTGGPGGSAALVATFADTFADLPRAIGDPFGLVGVQEWSFDRPPQFSICVETRLTGTGTWTPPANLIFYELEMVGGGGGGGGGYAGGGGGGGCYARFTLSPGSLPPGPVSYSVGAGGTGGSVFGAATAGADTTFGSFDVPGGAGGNSITNGGSPATPPVNATFVYSLADSNGDTIPIWYYVSPGGAGGTTTSVIAVPGQTGASAICLIVQKPGGTNVMLLSPPNGGGTPLGTGGTGPSSGGLGPVGFGGGGYGGVDNISSSTGSAGAPGAIIIRAYLAG